MDQLEEVDDIKENNLDLLMKHLNRLGKIRFGNLTEPLGPAMAQFRPRRGPVNHYSSAGTASFGHLQHH